ncbi:MAG: site-2 protease family protein [Acidobacteriota bacterium]
MTDIFFYNIPAFLIALGVIVFVHELGHHVVAKFFGVRVLTFSLGFGKRIWGFEHGGTDYRISAVPLGGYVRMSGEMPEDRSADPGDFLNKPRWQRILVYLAGPAMNVILSVGLIAGVFTQGIEVQALQGVPPIIGSVGEGSAAERAGLLPGDLVKTVNRQEVATWSDLEFYVSISPEKPLSLEIERNGQILTKELVPDKLTRNEIGDAGFFPQLQLRISEVIIDQPAHRGGVLPGDVPVRLDGEPISSDREAFIRHVEERVGQPVQIDVRRGDETVSLTVVPADVDGKGRIGVYLGFYRPLPIGEAIVESARFNVEIVEKTFIVLGKLFTREVKAKSALSGPIEIGSIAGRALKQGFKELIFIMGFLSISIGVMNLLPIPILDGGHIVILLTESLIRRDLSMAVKERFSQVGLLLLTLLMAMVIFFDLSKNLPGLFDS